MIANDEAAFERLFWFFAGTSVCNFELGMTVCSGFFGRWRREPEPVASKKAEAAA